MPALGRNAAKCMCVPTLQLPLPSSDRHWGGAGHFCGHGCVQNKAEFSLAVAFTCILACTVCVGACAYLSVLVPACVREQPNHTMDGSYQERVRMATHTASMPASVTDVVTAVTMGAASSCPTGTADASSWTCDTSRTCTDASDDAKRAGRVGKQLT
mmetsp:Transcript_21864/g.54981  ORF Transcript_21864/g.54981 Transcript_21864/m.54981 type:complete len:157 (-) Transcript_21864:501-971(-)